MIKGIDHIGIAVRDLTAAVRFFRDSLGLEPSGEEEVADQKVRLIFFEVGNVKIELLESTSPDGPIAKFIEKKGPGLHHLTLSTDNITGDLARVIGRVIDREPRPGAHGSKIAFVHPETTGGFLLELCEKKK